MPSVNKPSWATSGQPPLVTIITRTFPGRQNFLKTAAECVRRQTYRPIEWIVVEDGGDTAKALTEGMLNSGISVRHIPCPKVGRSAVANIALEAATGEYIGFYDDDDELFPDHVAILADILSKNKSATCAYAASFATYRDQSGQTAPQKTELHFTPLASSAILLETNPFPIQAALFRREHLALTRFNTSLDALEDWLFWIQLLLEREIVGTAEVTSRYYLPAAQDAREERLAAHRFHENKFRNTLQKFLQVRGAWDLACIAREHKRRLENNIEIESQATNVVSVLPERSLAGRQIDTALKHSLRPEPPKRSNKVAFTSITLSYLPKAKVWAESFKRFHPDWDVHILLNDVWPFDSWLDIGKADGYVEVRDLNIPNFHSWVFGLDEEELSCASRPYYFSRLMDRGYEFIFFFDPDIEMFASVDFLLPAATSSSVILTPHCEAQAISELEVHFTEMSVLAHGIYNLGFLALANDMTGRKVVEFWKDRLARYCLKDHARGLWTDQKWFNLVPLYFPGVHVLRHQGCNAASWNLAHRPIKERFGKIYAGNEPLVFFHFSGVDSGVPRDTVEMFQAYSSDFEAILQGYLAKVSLEAASTAASKMHWVYKQFDNGQAVSTGVKRFYRYTLDHRLNFPHPYISSANPSFYNYVLEKGIDALEEEYNSATKLRRYF